MVYRKLSFLFFSLILVLSLFLACSAEESPVVPGNLSSGKDIADFTIITPPVQGTVNSNAATVLVSLPNGTDVTALRPLIALSDSKATVTPASLAPQDFTSPVVYTVRAEDGSTKQYTVTVEVASPSSKRLLSFTVQGGIAGDVNEEANTAWAAVPYSTGLTNLVPVFSVLGSAVSNGTTNVESGTTVLDFSSPVVLTVYAADGSTTNYTVTITNAPARTDCLMTGFTVSGRTASIDDGAGTVTVSVPYGTDRTALTPTITVSGGATVSPVSGAATDFSSGSVSYVVTAEDGTTQKTYSVTVNEDAPSTECQLTTFSLDGNAGVINESAGTVAVTVPSGTDVTSLTASATFSTGATISPQTNTAQNFTSPQTYRVTAQDGSTYKDYVVSVTVFSGPSAYITAFCPDSSSSGADGGATWVDFKVANASSLAALGEWKLKCGTYKYVNQLIAASDISSWSLANGDTIRVHQDSWTNSTDTVKTDNNGDKWDYKTTSANSINYQYGTIWLEDGSGNIIDFVSYETDNGTQTYWLTTEQDDPLTILSNAVSGGFWTGTTRADAFDMGATTAIFARLKNLSADGGQPSDWETTDGSESDPPTVAIGSPADGAALTASSVTVSGTAADPGVAPSGVKEVWVRVDSGVAIKATGSVSWSAGVTGLTDGSHTIYAWSVDNSGNCSSTNSVSVTVTLPPDTTNPTVSITSPTSGQGINAGSLVVSGTANDPGTEPSGVAQVWVRVDSGSWTLASGTTSWSCTFTNVSDGSRTISVYAKDAKGNDSTTASVTVTYTYTSSPYSYIVDGKFQPSASDPYYSYYSSAAGLTGSALLSALHNIIDGHTTRSYDYLYTIYQDSDDTSDGKVWDMYSDRDGTGLDRPYTFTHVSDKCGSYSLEGDCYNREHTIPQSTFGSSSPMQSDAHHVIPTDGKVNGMRSAYPHGNVSSATWTSQNGSKRGTGNNAGYSGTVFEPNEHYRGDIARLYLYFSVRYRGNGSCSSWGAMDSGAVLKSWAQTVYTNWHFTDPVSQKEIDRNDAIAKSSAQGNRNPFIDYPGLALIIDFTQ